MVQEFEAAVEAENVELKAFSPQFAHNNVQPFLTMTFIIALVGLYPSRS